MVEVSVLGISVQSEGGSPVLLLHPHDTQVLLMLPIGPMEAFAVTAALHAREDTAPASSDDDSERPLTHDLLVNVILALGGGMAALEIVRAKGEVFYAEALLSSPAGPVRIPCRASDGIALALRMGASISAGESVIPHGRPLDEVMRLLPEHIRAMVATRLAARRLRSLGSLSPDFSRVPLVPVAQSGFKVSFPNDEPGAIPEPRPAGHTSLPESVRRKLDELMRDIMNRSANISAGAEPAGPKTDEPPFRSVGSPDKTPERGKTPPIISVSPVVVTQRKKPTIRVALVRQNSEGENEVINEFRLDAGDAAQPAPENLPGREAAAALVNENMSEEERWATLLRVLSPETKVLM